MGVSGLGVELIGESPLTMKSPPTSVTEVGLGVSPKSYKVGVRSRRTTYVPKVGEGCCAKRVLHKPFLTPTL